LNEDLENVRQFGDLEEWHLRWMENGRQDDDGRHGGHMNQRSTLLTAIEENHRRKRRKR
jgi:hypothetical protein